MLNLQSTIASQYANSPTILALVASMNGSLDPSVDINSFYDNMFNIQTATSYGLDCWGRIIKVARVLTVPVTTTSLTQFAFTEAGAQANGFGWGTFYSSSASNNFILSDDAYRQLILLKAASNIANCSIPALNGILKQLFVGQGRAYVTDTGNMQLILVFEFTLAPVQLAILLQSGVIATPCGVNYNVMDVPITGTLGFAEVGSGAAPFGQGAFFEGFESL
jgi:hypothetical protein